MRRSLLALVLCSLVVFSTCETQSLGSQSVDLPDNVIFDCDSTMLLSLSYGSVSRPKFDVSLRGDNLAAYNLQKVEDVMKIDGGKIYIQKVCPLFCVFFIIISLVC